MDNFSPAEYKLTVSRRATRSPLVKDMALAFLSGGLICSFGESLLLFYSYLGADEKLSGVLVSLTLIFLTALLTGFGIFDKIAEKAGAGTLVPITGFANAVVSPAIDNKAEGFITGLGAKIFIVSGPVILYGTLAGAIYGVLYWLVRLFV